MNKPLVEFLSRDLEWVQPNALKFEYELRAGDEVAATLKFRSSFGTHATAQSADGTWTMKRVGFFQTHVTVRESGAETDLAVFRNNTWRSGGTLEFPDGRHYRASTNLWQTKYHIQSAEDRVLLEYHTRGMLRLTGGVTVSREAATLKELPWLVALGWYLVVMLHGDSAASAGAS